MLYRGYRNLNEPFREVGEWFESETVPPIPVGFDGIWNEVQQAAWIATQTPTPLPATFAEYTSIEQFQRSMQTGIVNIGNFRTWKDSLYTFVLALGNGNEEAGFEAISPTINDSPEKAFAASYNIGTGLQRLLAIPNDQERDKAGYDFIVLTNGIDSGAKGIAATWIRTIVFSRLSHVLVPNYGNAPFFIFAQINIMSNIAYEISGNLLNMFGGRDGIDGFALGGAPLGLSDYIQESGTATGLPFDTRYAPANGGGLRTNATLVAAVEADTYGISGFANLAALADFMFAIMEQGKPTY